VNNGADINIVDSKQVTPLSLAIANNYDNIEVFLKSLGAITKRKMSSNKSKSKLESSVIAEPMLQKYILVTLNKYGQEIPMTNEEIIKFLEANPRIKKLVHDQMPTHEVE
jgi:ankyrin repeat protein